MNKQEYYYKQVKLSLTQLKKSCYQLISLEK